MSRVVIVLGSKSDLDHGRAIAAGLAGFGVDSEIRIASAHKVTRQVLEILDAYEATGEIGLYVTVAGRSNALSGVVDANVTAPVLACPPYGERYGGMDLLSSVRMPSGVAPLLVLEPEAAALAAVKILALGDPALRAKVTAYQAAGRDKILTDDAALDRPNAISLCGPGI